MAQGPRHLADSFVATGLRKTAQTLTAAEKAQVQTNLGVPAGATTLAGYGITDAQPLDAELTTLAAVSTAGIAKVVVYAGLKKYVALLTQSGTNAPVATVLENTLGGTVVWTRTGAGSYTGTLVGAFTTGKTLVFLGPSSRYLSGAQAPGDNNTVLLDTGTDISTAADDLLNIASLSIIVYP